MAALSELLLEREIVLDDAVVDHDDLAGAVAVRMGVLFGGTSVSGPARVADAVGAVHRLEADDLFEVAQLALGAADFEPFAVAGDRDARGVVSAILEPLEAIEDHGNHALFTDVSDDSTHKGDFRMQISDCRI